MKHFTKILTEKPFTSLNKDKRKNSDENQISSTTNSYQHHEQNNTGIMNFNESISINTVDSTQTSDHLFSESLEENCSSSNTFDIDFNREDQSIGSTNFIETVKADFVVNRIIYSRQELFEYSKTNFCNILPDFLINNSKAPLKKEDEDKNLKNKCKSIHFIKTLTPQRNNFNCGCSVNNRLKLTLNNKNLSKDEILKVTKSLINSNTNNPKKKTLSNEVLNEKNDLDLINKYEEKRDRNFLRSRGENLNYNFANARQIFNPNCNKSDKFNKNNKNRQDEEPEWFTNPVNQHDTIELKGFEDDDKISLENKNTNSKNVNNYTHDNSKKFDINEIFKFDLRKYIFVEPESNKILDKNNYEGNNTSRFARWFNKQKTIENQLERNVNFNDLNAISKQESINEPFNVSFNSVKEDEELHKSEQQLINILQKARINVDHLFNCKVNDRFIKEQAKSLTELEADLLQGVHGNYNTKNNVKTEKDVNGIFVKNTNENSINPFVMNLLGDAQKQKKLKQINYLQDIICNNSNNTQNDNIIKNDENKPHPFMPTCVIRKIAKDKNLLNKNINENQFETVTGKYLNERAIIKNLNELEPQSEALEYQNNQLFQKLFEQNIHDIYQQNENKYLNIIYNDSNQHQRSKKLIFDNDFDKNQFSKQDLINIQKLKYVKKSNDFDEEKLFDETKSWNNSVLKNILIKASTNRKSNHISANINEVSNNFQNENDQLLNQKRLIEILQKASRGIQNNCNNNFIPINKFFDNELIKKEKNLLSNKPKILLLEDIEKN